MTTPSARKEEPSGAVNAGIAGTSNRSLRMRRSRIAADRRQCRSMGRNRSCRRPVRRRNHRPAINQQMPPGDPNQQMPPGCPYPAQQPYQDPQQAPYQQPGAPSQQPYPQNQPAGVPPGENPYQPSARVAQAQAMGGFAAEPPKKRSKLALILWLMIPVIILVGLAGAYWKREALMDRFAFTESVFSMIGVETPHPRRFFKLKQLNVRQQRRGGSLIQIVDLDVENISSRPRTIPVLEGVILDRDRKVVESWDIPIELVKLAPGEKKPFSTEIKNSPPAGGVFRIFVHRRNGKK